jgi:unsaturated rhamnogalacturonyl hydrolase
MSNAMIAAAVLAAALATLEADVRAVAALPGEPSMVAAAGLTRDDRPILTLENPSAFDPASTRRRVVLFAAGGNARTASLVLETVRWFKTRAPQPVRDEVEVSAMPSADFDPADNASFTRWLRFQAADVAIEVVEGDSRPIGVGAEGIKAVVARTPIAPETLGGMLRGSGDQAPSSRATIKARAARDPETIARLLAAKYPGTPAISYISALSWVGALRLAESTGDASLRDKVGRQVEPWLSGAQPLFGDRILLTSVAGTIVFSELARRGDAAAAALAGRGAALAAARKNDGTAEYGQGWTDDMFMAASILARESVRGNRPSDLDAAAALLANYAKRLQRADGLFNHAVDGPAAWGRGNGFAAFGLIEALSVMPERHPLRAPLLDVYRRHMAAVRQQQSPDGSWREVIDEPGAYREETATAMLMTAMARGLRSGWLDDSYRPVVERAWRAVAAHVAEDGSVIDVCTGTGAGPTKRYYLDRAAITGADDRGGAMALVAAMEWDALRRPSSRRP